MGMVGDESGWDGMGWDGEDIIGGMDEEDSDSVIASLCLGLRSLD